MINVESVSETRDGERLTRLVYAVLLLFVITALYVSLLFRYNSYLIHTKQFSFFRTFHEYSDLTESLIYAIELLVVLSLFRPLGRIFTRQQAEAPLKNPLPRDLAWGLVGGIATLVAAAPGLILEGRSSALGTFLVNHLYSPGGFILVFLLVFLLPIASEGFFRGVLLRHLLRAMSAPAAIIVSTVVFTLCWPTFNPIAAIAVGAGAGIVFYRTGSILACIITNSTFTVLAVIVLMWRSLSA